MLNGNEYVVTVKDNKTDEAYLSVIVEDVPGGKMVKSIVQNSKVSTEVNEEHVKKLLAFVNGTTVDELPVIEDLASKVLVVEATNKIGDDYIVELDFKRFFFRRLNLKSILIQAQTSRRKGEAVPCVRYQYARLTKPNGENLKSISSRGGVKRPTLVGSGQKPRRKN